MAAKQKDRGKHMGDWMFVADVGLTVAGSIRIQFRPTPPLRSIYGHERALAELIYTLAAEFERRCGEMGAAWAIAPDPFNARLDVELGEGEDPEAASDVVVVVLTDFGLA